MELPALAELTCQEAVERIADYLDGRGGLSSQAREVLEEHLHACPWCMTYLHQTSSVAEAAHALVAPHALPSAETEARLHAMFRAYSASAGPFDATRGGAQAASSTPPARRPVVAGPTRYALKFTARGAISPIARTAWPVPHGAAGGDWLHVDTPLVRCRSGLHACTRANLARWLHDELWLVELGGAVVVTERQLLASSARLTRHISAWDGALQRAFMEAALDHARTRVCEHGQDAANAAAPHLASAERHIPRGNVALSTYCAAMAAARAAGGAGFAQSGYDDERDYQSRWLSKALGLDTLIELAYSETQLR